MSDERFDQDLRSVLLEDAPRDVPDDLRRRIAAIPATHPVGVRASRPAWRGPALFGAGLLAAAAVVVVALGVIRLSPPDAPNVGTQPTPSAPTATPSVGPSASPSAPAAVSACGAADLEARILGWQGAAGSRIAEIQITNTGAVACIIHGTPALQLVDANDRVLIDSTAAGASGKPHVGPGDPSFELAPGAIVGTEVQVSNYCGATPMAPIDIAVDLPSNGGQLMATPAAGVSSDEAVPPCNGTAPAVIGMNGWRQ